MVSWNSVQRFSKLSYPYVFLFIIFSQLLIAVELNPAYEDPRSYLQENNNPEPRNTVTTTNNNIIDIRQNPSYSLVEMNRSTGQNITRLLL